MKGCKISHELTSFSYAVYTLHATLGKVPNPSHLSFGAAAGSRDNHTGLDNVGQHPMGICELRSEARGSVGLVPSLLALSPRLCEPPARARNVEEIIRLNLDLQPANNCFRSQPSHVLGLPLREDRAVGNQPIDQDALGSRVVKALCAAQGLDVRM